MKNTRLYPIKNRTNSSIIKNTQIKSYSQIADKILIIHEDKFKKIEKYLNLISDLALIKNS